MTGVAVGRTNGRDVIGAGSLDGTVRVWRHHTANEILIQNTLDPVAALTVVGDHIIFATGNAICAVRLPPVRPRR